jgi:plasmid replication initiation protein
LREVSAFAVGQRYDSLYKARVIQIAARAGMDALREHVGRRDSAGDWRIDIEALQDTSSQFDSSVVIKAACNALDGKDAEEISRLPMPAPMFDTTR